MSALERWPWLSGAGDSDLRETVITGTAVSLATVRQYRRGGQSLAQLIADYPVLREYADAAASAWGMTDSELDAAIDVAPAINAWIANVNRAYEAMQTPGFVRRALDALEPPFTARPDLAADEPADEERGET